jgi:hypothetical protein
VVMGKSTKGGTRDAATRYAEQFTMRLSAPERQGFHQLALREGLSLAALVRIQLRRAFKDAFGREVA